MRLNSCAIFASAHTFVIALSLPATASIQAKFSQAMTTAENINASHSQSKVGMLASHSASGGIAELDDDFFDSMKFANHLRKMAR